MAVHNGAAWLEQQVVTIAAQSLRPRRLLVLNDGSSDGSAALLERLEVAHGGWLQQLPRGPQQGCVANFGRLLAATTAPYVALADQDDLWDRHKLAASLEHLQAAEVRFALAGLSQPLLVHSDARLIDSEDKLLHPSWWQRQRLELQPQDLWHLAARNRVMGCTVLLNRACLEAALPIPPEAVLHDWWLALVAQRTGGLLQLPEASLSYRIHGANLSRPARWWQWPQRGWAVWRQWCALQHRFHQPVLAADAWRLLQRRIGGEITAPSTPKQRRVPPL